MKGEEKWEALRRALQQEREQIEIVEIKEPRANGFCRSLVLLLRCLEPEAAAVFQERLWAMSRAFIHRRSTAPGTITPDMHLVEALSLAVLLLIDCTLEGPVLHEYASTEEAVATYLAFLDR